MNDYEAAQSVIKYLDFLHSENGKIQKDILSKAIFSALPQKSDLAILDAGCGPGWLSEQLKPYGKVLACDSSELFIKFARTHHKGIDFQVCQLESPLPYAESFFNVVILNMVGPDLENLNLAMQNVSKVLKPNGKLIMTIPNPKYSFPAAVWKKSLVDFLLLRKPKLKLKTPPASGTKIFREFGTNKKIPSFYYTEEDYINGATQAGLKLIETQELRSHQDSKKFNLTYQLHRYPLILLMEFTK